MFLCQVPTDIKVCDCHAGKKKRAENMNLDLEFNLWRVTTFQLKEQLTRLGLSKAIYYLIYIDGDVFVDKH